MLNKLNAKLENLFDQSTHDLQNIHEVAKDAQNNFQPVSDNQMLENLSYVFSNEIKTADLPNLFYQLSSYFEIGLLFKKNENPNHYLVSNLFIYSKKIILTENIKSARLPQHEIFRILKTDASSFLNRFGLSHLDPENKMSAYLIPLSADYTLVVISGVAEPWARLKIESLQKTLMKINFSI